MKNEELAALNITVKFEWKNEAILHSSFFILH